MSKGTPEVSVIVGLWRERETIFRVHVKRKQDFSAETQSRVEAITAVIANGVAQNRREAAIQMRIARELLEAGCDDELSAPTMTERDLRLACAAVRSAEAIYNKRAA